MRLYAAAWYVIAHPPVSALGSPLALQLWPLLIVELCGLVGTGAMLVVLVIGGF